MKAGGSESMYSLLVTQIFKANSLKKIRPKTLIAWMLERVEKKMTKKGKKCKKYYFFVLNKYQSLTHVSTSIYSFRNITFLGYFRFFLHRPDFLMPCTTLVIKKNFTKNPFNFFSLKVTKFHSDVSKMRVLGQKKLEVGGVKRPPPSSK